VPRLATAILLLAACRAGHPAATPEQAYASFAAAARDGDARRAFECLDLQSRWAVMSIHRSEREIHQLVAEHYPTGARAREMARYGSAAATEDPAEFFAREFGARLEATRAQVSVGARTEPGADGRSATLVTPAGTGIPFARGDDGRWGWSGLRAELEARKTWAANALATVREGAVKYRR